MLTPRNRLSAAQQHFPLSFTQELVVRQGLLHAQDTLQHYISQFKARAAIGIYTDACKVFPELSATGNAERSTLFDWQLAMRFVEQTREHWKFSFAHELSKVQDKYVGHIEA
jgi:hypothetical protein